MKGILRRKFPPKGTLPWVAALVVPPITAAYLMQLAYGVAPWQFSFLAALGNALCLGVLYFLLCALTGRWVISCLVLHLAAGVWGALNYFVALYRGTPILPWDLTSLGTAAAVSGSYSFTPTLAMVIALVLLAALGAILVVRAGTGRIPGRSRRLVCLAACLACLVLVTQPTILERFGVGANTWDQAGGYRSSGVLGSFLRNAAFLQVEKPEGLDAQHLANLLPQAGAADENPNADHEGELPNLVVIMNESWADFEEFGNLNLTQPVLDDIPNLDNAIWGHAYTSIFGAGTSASEFEFLTGCSMAFLPAGSIPYQQYIKEPTPSLAWLLRQAGYETLAFHPGERDSWQRDDAYPLLGFEEYLCGEDMDVPQEFLHGYVSDSSDFDQVIWEFEHKQEGQPLFLFNVTIQSHGGYTYEGYPTTVQLADHPGQYPKAEQYLSLVRETDQAFQKLVDYFSQQEEPTVILMYGDHQPSVEQEFLDLAYGVTQDKMTMEQYMDRYRVPYVMWANYPLPEEITGEDTSLNFLALDLLTAAGLEGDNFMSFLAQLREQMPVATFVGYEDTEGNAYSHLETTALTPLLDDYQCVQYERLFGLEDESQSGSQ